jgi:hypothetical protein
MLFDFTVSRGQLLFTGAAIEDRIMAGSENAITPREIIIGGF